jgi:hypothetical protein
MRLMYREYMRKISFTRHPDEKQEDQDREGNGDMVKQRMVWGHHRHHKN